MGSSTGTPEIVEVKEELESSRRYRSHSSLGTRSALDDELNKLFESISRRSSSRGSASSTQGDSVSGKRPVSSSVPQSPRISAEPVSIKQALRDLCISKASEMAAIKRSNKQCSSPGASEAGRIKTLYEVVVSDKLEEQREETKAKTAQIVKKLASLTSQSSPKTSAQSSPRYGGCPSSQKPPPSKITLPNPKAKCTSPKPQTPRETPKKLPIQSSSGSCDASTEIPKKLKRGTKLGGKSKLRGIHVNRIAKVNNTNSRISKPPLKRSGSKRNFKSKQTATAKTHLVCQNCQCAIKEDPMTATEPNPTKPKQNCELSLTSKSSLGEFSTSTSNSEESTLSRPSCGHKPHMSKDLRWEVIRRTKQRDGILTLKHFNLLKKLGCGDIGTVYLAELIGSSCLFAIKVMDNEFLARRKKMSRAHTEREILRTLDHPFLPTLYTQFTSDNLSCLVMEFCPGGDLHVLRQKQPGRCFPEPAARFYVAEVLLALEYLHMLGIIYRDLKPENILVREDGHIMLTDFDLSLTCNVKPTLLESSAPDADPSRVSGPCAESNCIDPFCMKPASCFTPRMKVKKGNEERVNLLQLVAEPSDARSNSFVGTHEYLAPEIIKGEGHGAAVDWWTFGVFLYELLYGRTPFKGCGNEETLANVVVDGLTFPDAPLVSVQARDLMRRLLVKEPEGRLGAAKGAAEIKTHPFFEGLNWALIRCAVPPETPEGVRTAPFVKTNKLMECKTTGDHLEFELF